MMVFYLGIDYLSNAIEARKKLLAKCLITVPNHLEKFDSVPYNEDGADRTYKTPWTKAKSDDQFLFGESVTVKEDATKLTSVADSLQPEPYNSCKNEDTSVEDSATFDLDCDIVPSSNPSSAETLCSNGVLEDGPNFFQEKFLQEALEQKGNWKLETLIRKELDDDDYIGEARDACSLKVLQAKLQAVSVPDPLVLAVKLHPVDSYISNKENGFESCTNTLQGYCGAGILEDSFKKEEIAALEQGLEEVELTDDFPDNVDIKTEVSSLLLSAVLPRTRMQVQQDVSLQKEFEATFHPEAEDISQLETPDISIVEDSKITFVEINDTGNEEVDKFCDSAWLDSPLASSPEPSLDWLADRLKCEAFEMSQSTPRLLSEGQQKELSEKCLSSEYFLDEIQADRLPEPHMADMDIRRVIGTGVQDLARVFNTCVDRGIGSLELDLPWQLLKYMDPAFTSWSTLALLSTDQPTDEFGCKTDIEPVEICHKYTSAEMQEFQAEASDRYTKANGKMDLLESEMNSKTMTSALTSTSTEDAPSAKPLKIPVKPWTLSCSLDPVGDFMALRSKPVQNDQASKPSVSAVALKPSIQATEIPPQIPKKDSKRGSKHHVATVKLSHEFQCIVDYMEETATPYVQHLRQCGELATTSVFRSLTPDGAKFNIQQREKYIRDERIEASNDEVYKSAVCLYALCQAVEHLHHCCLEAAIGFLSAVLEEYHVIRKSVLGSVLKKLVDKQGELSRSQTHHPKVVRLCREIETWLRKKRAKSGDTEQKILVLVKTDVPSSLNCLKNALGNGNLLVPEILASHKSEDIIQSLDTHNCLIACPRFVQAEFPWAQFSLVVEQEYRPGSDWQLACQRQNIRHIGIQLQIEPALTDKTLSNDQSSKFTDKQISLIGSLETITSNTELLQLLESKYNMLLLERDYGAVGVGGALVYSDLDVDTSSCIIVTSLTDLQDDCSVQGVVRKLVALSIKYSHCFCLLSSVQKTNGYELPGHVVTNLSHLKAATANLTARLPDYTVKFVHCGEVSDLAQQIRCISELCLSEVPADRRQAWLDRAWLAQEVSQEEKFLLMNPCLSSYSIQLMLQIIDLKHLISSSQDELLRMFPDIPAKIIEAFHSHVNISRGLHLQSNSDCDEGTERAIGSVEEFTANMSPGVPALDRANPDMLAQDRVNPCVDYRDKEAVEITRARRLSGEQVNSVSGNTEPDRVNSGHHEHRDQLSKQGSGNNKTIEGFRTEKSQPDKSNNDVYRDEMRLHVTSWNNLEQFVADRNQLPSSGNKTFNSINLAGAGVDGTAVDFTGPQGRKPTKHARNIYGTDDAASSVKDNASRFDTAQYRHQYENNRHCLQRHQVEGRQTPAVTNERSDYRQQNLYLPSNSQVDTILPSGVYTSRQARDNNGRTSRCFQESMQGPSPCNQFTADQSRSVPVETFDYNHGLAHNGTATLASMPLVRETTNYSNGDRAFQEEFMLEYQKHHPITTEVDSIPDFHGSNAFSNTLSASCQSQYMPLQEQNNEVDSTDLEFRSNQESMADIARQFPSSRDIDSQERLQRPFENTRIASHLANNQTYELPLQREQFTSFDDPQGVAHVNSYSANIPNDPEYGKQPDWQNTFPSSSRNDGFQFQPSFNYNETLTDNAVDVSCSNTKRPHSREPELHADSRPEVVSSYFKAGSDSNSALKKQLQQANRMNPNLERVSLRPSFKAASDDKTSDDKHSNQRKDFATSLTDDLRETTRRLLENSQQFSKLDSHFVRRPLQAVNIGLAQPLPRKNREGEKAKEAMRERRLMEQSMWASDSSPPMDLEEEADEMAQHPHCSDLSNRAVFSYQTPSKKRKLTYQRVPGRRGQTKLIFS